MMGFDTCYFAELDEACVFIASRTGQSKAHRFYKCGFSFAPFGIFHETGSFVTFGCAFGYHTDAAVRLGSITDYIAINESDSEGCARFLKTRSEEHTSELQSQSNLVCRLLLEKKKHDEICKLGLFYSILPGSASARSLLDLFQVTVTPAGRPAVVCQAHARVVLCVSTGVEFVK